jgi:hypothetical protein
VLSDLAPSAWTCKSSPGALTPARLGFLVCARLRTELSGLRGTGRRGRSERREATAARRREPTTLRSTVGSRQPESLYFLGSTWSRMRFLECVWLQLFLNLFRSISVADSYEIRYESKMRNHGHPGWPHVSDRLADHSSVVTAAERTLRNRRRWLAPVRYCCPMRG